MKIIDVPYDFTSYEFYTNILPQMKQTNDSEIVIDMSNTRRIEPLVIPNLLCIAFQLKTERLIVPQIYIPDTVLGGRLRNYLYEIGFTKYANASRVFEFLNNEYGGLSGKQIDPICGTLVFNADDSRETIYRGVDMFISPFADAYLSRFQIFDKSQTQYMNEITEFLEEILMNCKIHADSVSVTTLHANHAANKIFISVSDVGCGFSNTIDDYTGRCEKDAILAGVYRRKDSKIYGLYNVIRRVLEYDGKVRIHSNDTQIIFTPRILDAFVDNELHSVSLFEKYNVKKTAQYDGVHIEMELPLEKGRNYVYNRR